MSKVVSTLPSIWEEDVYTVLRLVKRHVDFINDELIPAINDNADDITTLETYVANIKTQIQSISVEIDGISDTLEAYRLEFAEIKNAIDSINTKITTINSSIVTINQNITSLNTKVNTNTANISTLQTNYVTMRDDVDGLQSNYNGIEGQLGDLQVDFTALESKVNTNETNISAIANEVNGYSDKINALENLKYVVVDTTDTWQIPSTDYNYYVTTNIPVDTLNILLPSHGPGSGIYKTQKIYITSFWEGASGNLVLMTSSGYMRPFKIGYDSATGTGATTITLPSGLTSNKWFGELTIVYKAGKTTTNDAFVRFD